MPRAAEVEAAAFRQAIAIWPEENQRASICMRRSSHFNDGSAFAIELGHHLVETAFDVERVETVRPRTTQALSTISPLHS